VTRNAGCARWKVAGLFDAAGKAWAFPNTLIGLLLGVVAWPLGARFFLGENAIGVRGFPLGRGALTLGNVVIYARRCSPDERVCMYGDPRRLPVGRHEAAHTFQYQLLGPLFVAVYLACGGVSARNPLEQAANDYAAGGHWWPPGWPFASLLRRH
jgi:hypothetical protein